MGAMQSSKSQEIVNLQFINSCSVWYEVCDVASVKRYRGKSPNMGRCIISYQEVLHSLLKNVSDQAHEAVLCNQSINGQSRRTSVLTGRFCFGAL